jgi:hypothetical protein
MQFVPGRRSSEGSSMALLARLFSFLSPLDNRIWLALQAVLARPDHGDNLCA